MLTVKDTEVATAIGFTCDDLLTVIDNNDGPTIYVDSTPVDDEKIDKTINLIEAAPDLLAACEAALSLLQNIGKGNWAQTPAGDALRAALAKAKGQ